MSKDFGAQSEQLTALRRAVADLSSQVIRQGEDNLVFHDHDGEPARVRFSDQAFVIGWLEEEGEESLWRESGREFDNPREAAFHAFQGPARAG